MTSTTSPTVLKLAGPGDIVAYIPYLLGYEPKRSVVLLALEGKRLLLSARADLDDVATFGAADLFAPALFRLREASGDPQALLVAYGDTAEEADKAALDSYEALDAPIPLCLAIAGGEWWHAGERYGTGGVIEDDSRVATECVYAGLQRRRGVAELEALVEPAWEYDDDILDHMLGVAEAMPADRAAVRLRNLLGTPGAPGELKNPQLVQAAALLWHPSARDMLWIDLDRETADFYLPLLCRIVRSVPAETGLPALCMAGIAAWLAGGGTLLSIIGRRAYEIDPDFHLTGLLADIHSKLIPPDEWASMRGVAWPGV